jgi:wyosine [tRNA(Phe)-imidazoG37] synthetase (radical SAM superfamily)
VIYRCSATDNSDAKRVENVALKAYGHPIFYSNLVKIKLSIHSINQNPAFDVSVVEESVILLFHDQPENVQP